MEGDYHPRAVYRWYSADSLTNLCVRYGADGLVFCGGEPGAWLEYVLDVFKAAEGKNLLRGTVISGLLEEAPAGELFELADKVTIWIDSAYNEQEMSAALRTAEIGMRFPGKLEILWNMPAKEGPDTMAQSLEFLQKLSALCETNGCSREKQPLWIGGGASREIQFSLREKAVRETEFKNCVIWTE